MAQSKPSNELGCNLFISSDHSTSPLWDAAMAQIALAKLMDGLSEAISAVFRLLMVVSLFNSATGTREVVPYHKLPTVQGENANRGQEWLAECLLGFSCHYIRDLLSMLTWISTWIFLTWLW
jgi:hypothetical protein